LFIKTWQVLQPGRSSESLPQQPSFVHPNPAETGQFWCRQKKNRRAWRTCGWDKYVRGSNDLL